MTRPLLIHRVEEEHRLELPGDPRSGRVRWILLALAVVLGVLLVVIKFPTEGRP